MHTEADKVEEPVTAPQPGPGPATGTLVTCGDEQDGNDREGGADVSGWACWHEFCHVVHEC